MNTDQPSLMERVVETCCDWLVVGITLLMAALPFMVGIALVLWFCGVVVGVASVVWRWSHALWEWIH
jgi:preprotein translocase subunit SecF